MEFLPNANLQASRKISFLDKGARMTLLLVIYDRIRRCHIYIDNTYWKCNTFTYDYPWMGPCIAKSWPITSFPQ